MFFAQYMGGKMFATLPPPFYAHTPFLNTSGGKKPMAADFLPQSVMHASRGVHKNQTCKCKKKFIKKNLSIAEWLNAIIDVIHDI